MARFIMTHQMMSTCVTNEDFFERVPAFKPIHREAKREADVRKPAFERAAKKGCSSCGKKAAARVRKEMHKRHGALFSQHISSLLSRDGLSRVNFRKYVSDHYAQLTGVKDATPAFEKVTMYLPVKNDKTGVIEAIEVEV